MTDFDIVIIGAGMAGSALAASLTGHGLKIAIVEAQPLQAIALPGATDLDTFDRRVSALTPRSQQLLDDIGAWPAIAAYRHCAYSRMSVWDAQGTGAIEFDCGEVAAPRLGTIVENRSVVAALLDLVLAAGDITPVSPARVNGCRRDPDGSMVVTLENEEELRCALVVAADGALSPVREMMGFATREWDYGHRAIVCTVEVEHSHENTAWQRFLPTGPLAFLPLGAASDAHYCSIVWSLDDAEVEGVLALDDGDFCCALTEAFEGRLGAVKAASGRVAFPLRQRHAVDYVQAGVALVADAAHTIHPLAGQGINLGFADVAVLAQEILAGQRRGAAPGQLALLKRYQRRRKGENLLMMAAMDGFKRLFEERALPVRWLRNAGMRSVAAAAPLKQQLMRHAMGLRS